ncbi:MAG: hypothetical protein KY446_11565 [Proteobacteria bacterium]|nr:hypothetical protein [Pseudomonadota bacterium]MBW3618355.1 hypothetical protein [Pseudomonadota bacterium]
MSSAVHPGFPQSSSSRGVGYEARGVVFVLMRVFAAMAALELRLRAVQPVGGPRPPHVPQAL